MSRRTEPQRPDRAAKAGKLCVWVELADGTSHRLAGQFDTLGHAMAAADKVIRHDVGTGRLGRVLVYDDEGQFRLRWPPEGATQPPIET